MFVCFPSWFIFVVLLSGRLCFPSNCPVVTQLKTLFVLPKANFRQVGLKTKKTKPTTAKLNYSKQNLNWGIITPIL